ncbi:MAG: SH3 domain-containing protein [Clostridiales bacterium]|nr:SH3 domain-containing protein [Clostridiales bacterium]
MYKTGNYIIYKEHMNLRIKPKVSSDVLCVIPQGTCIEVVEVWDNWGKITYDDYTGWCCISECFAKLVCSCNSDDCCYFKKYDELNNKYQELLKDFEKIKKIIK